MCNKSLCPKGLQGTYGPADQLYLAATIIGAVVGCALPPPGSSVTATAASEPFGIAYVACIITSPLVLGMNVPALIFADDVTSQSWYVRPVFGIGT